MSDQRAIRVNKSLIVLLGLREAERKYYRRVFLRYLVNFKKVLVFLDNELFFKERIITYIFNIA